MVCEPVRSIILSLELDDYLSVQAHKPCSISHLLTLFRPDIRIGEICKQGKTRHLIRVYTVCLQNFYEKYNKVKNIHQKPFKLEMDSSK